MSKRTIVIHIIIVLVLSIVVALVIHYYSSATIDGYISGIGSVASIYAMLLTLHQLGKVKDAADASKEAVVAKTREIETLFSLVDIERHIEVIPYIAMCLQSNQNEAAALRMADLKKVLVVLKEDGDLSQDSRKRLQGLIRQLGVDIVAVRGNWQENEKIDLRRIQQNMDSISTYLQEVSAVIKKEAYVG